MSQNPAKATPNLVWPLTIALLRIVHGEEAAIQKENELMMPERVRRSGIFFSL
jgi:hypothetical protein